MHFVLLLGQRFNDGECGNTCLCVEALRVRRHIAALAKAGLSAKIWPVHGRQVQNPDNYRKRIAEAPILSG